ncbi:MAG: NERD domain-containing protein [Lachnospiraceae bacterium]|nr:NERD domain-containing protein [Lachnospiraceae bacterium]
MMVDNIKQFFEGAKRFLNNSINVFTNGEPLYAEGDSDGERGEYSSEYVLNNLAIKDLTYIRTLRNVYIENNGRTTEIDVIALTEKGILVIESKNYGGWIFGSIGSQKWLQSFKNGERHEFYNPVLQNETHINKLVSLLGLTKENVFSYIVFSDRCTLKRVPESTDRLMIIQRNDLLWSVKDMLKKIPSIFSQNEIDSFYDKLLPLTDVTKETKEKHIEQAERFKTGDVCPVCGGRLVKRNGKYGEFYGCSGYPKCTYTRNVK